MSELNEAEAPPLPEGLESQERNVMEQEITQIDHMIDDMEMKVNVLRWMVEPHGPQYAEPLSSTDSASMALLGLDEEQPGQQAPSQGGFMFVVLLLGILLAVLMLSLCIVFLS